MKILVINPVLLLPNWLFTRIMNRPGEKVYFILQKTCRFFIILMSNMSIVAACYRSFAKRVGIPLCFDAVIARGGLLKPTPGGVYRINERIKHDLWHADMEHASNLAALIADELAAFGRMSFFYCGSGSHRRTV